MNKQEWEQAKQLADGLNIKITGCFGEPAISVDGGLHWWKPFAKNPTKTDAAIMEAMIIEGMTKLGYVKFDWEFINEKWFLETDDNNQVIWTDAKSRLLALALAAKIALKKIEKLN